jgi:hypothetical protein
MNHLNVRNFNIRSIGIGLAAAAALLFSGGSMAAEEGKGVSLGPKVWPTANQLTIGVENKTRYILKGKQHPLAEGGTYQNDSHWYNISPNSRGSLGRAAAYRGSVSVKMKEGEHDIFYANEVIGNCRVIFAENHLRKPLDYNIKCKVDEDKAPWPIKVVIDSRTETGLDVIFVSISH